MPENDLTPVCTRCGSDAVIPDAFLYIRDMGGAPRMQVGVYKKPEALMIKEPVRTDLRMRVCGDCGLVEVESADPRALWEAYMERLSREFGG